MYTVLISTTGGEHIAKTAFNQPEEAQRYFTLILEGGGYSRVSVLLYFHPEGLPKQLMDIQYIPATRYSMSTH